MTFEEVKSTYNEIANGIGGIRLVEWEIYIQLPMKLIKVERSFLIILNQER